MRIAKYGTSERKEEYRSYVVGLVALPERFGERDGELLLGCGETALRSSACKRGMKPGSIGVPPVTRMPEARVFRRSTGACMTSMRLQVRDSKRVNHYYLQ